MEQEISGTDLFVFMNGVPIAHATNHSLSVKMDTRPTSNKDTGVFKTRGKGRLDATASCEGLAVYGDVELLRTAMVNRTPLSLDFGEQVGGALDESKIYATGNFYLVGLDEGAPDDDNATWNASFEHESGFEYVNEGELSVRIAHSNCTTHEGTEGAAFALPLGGTPPYTYAWTGGGSETTQYIVAKAAGSYKVTVTDDDSAEVEATVVIIEPSA